jgi:hypothetical protein
MKLSTEQHNYLVATALRDEAVEKCVAEDSPQNDRLLDDAFDLVEARELELFIWGRSRAKTLHRQLSTLGMKPQAITPALEMLDKAITGELIRKRHELVQLLLKLEALITNRQ